MWEPVGPLPAAVYWRRRGVAAVAALALVLLTAWGVAAVWATPQESTPTTRTALSNPQPGVDGGTPIAAGAAGAAGGAAGGDGWPADAAASPVGADGGAAGGPQPGGAAGAAGVGGPVGAAAPD